MMPPTIRIHPNPSEYAFINGKKGDVVFICLHGLEWPAELRAKPPRVRLLEDGRRRPGPVLCEILDPWPNAPDYWPPEWKPGARPAVGNFYEQCPVPG